MKLIREYEHNDGLRILPPDHQDEIGSALNRQDIMVSKGMAGRINGVFRQALASKGWALKPKVHPGFGLTINAMKSRTGLTMQTGNIVRAFYDLLKFEVMFKNSRIDVGVLVLPSKDAATKLGSNVANYLRVTSEFELFEVAISIPCVVIAFDD